MVSNFITRNKVRFHNISAFSFEFSIFQITCNKNNLTKLVFAYLITDVNICGGGSGESNCGTRRLFSGLCAEVKVIKFSTRRDCSWEIKLPHYYYINLTISDLYFPPGKHISLCALQKCICFIF